MPVFHRIDVLMNMNNSGWSETYYNNATDLQQTEAKVQLLLPARTVLLNQNAAVVGYRIKRYDANGLPDRAFRGKARRTASMGLTGQQKVKRDVSAVSVLWEWSDDNGAFRKRNWMRGFPDDSVVFQDDGNDSYSTGLSKAMDAYKAVVIANGFCIRQFERGEVANPPVTITNIKFLSDGRMNLVLKTPQPTWLPGKRIKVVGYKGEFKGHINGLTKIADVLPDDSLLTDKQSLQYANDEGSGNGAQAFLEMYSTGNITKGGFEAFTRHDTGRPFFPTRGRQSDPWASLVTRAAGASIGSAARTRRTSSPGATPTS